MKGKVCKDIPYVEAGLTSTSEDMDVDEPLLDDVNLANAVNLSESEDEVEEEQVAGDFFATPDPDFVCVHSLLPWTAQLCFGTPGQRFTAGQNIFLPIPAKFSFIYLPFIDGY